MKKSIKEELLEILKKDMREMMMQEKGQHMSDLMPKMMEGDEDPEMTKVTVAGDSPEAVQAGLNKAEEIMKAKFGDKKKKKDSDK